jgi:hypothetical protein
MSHVYGYHQNHHDHDYREQTVYCGGCCGSEKRVTAEKGFLAFRILLLLTFPIGTFVSAATFDAVSEEGPQQLRFSIPIIIFAILELIWFLYLFIDLCYTIFAKTNHYQRRDNEDPIQKKVSLFSVFEVIVHMVWGLTLWAYAIYLFDNNQFRDTTNVLTASLVNADESHLKILWIFIFYIPLVAYGIGVTKYLPIGFWAELVTYVSVIAMWTLGFILVGTVISIALDRRDRRRSMKKRKYRK